MDTSGYQDQYLHIPLNGNGLIDIGKIGSTFLQLYRSAVPQSFVIRLLANLCLLENVLFVAP
jgi:hypothetical protein